MGEEWKPVKGYEGLYSVSNYGRVLSLRTMRILKQRPLPTGYLRVNLPATERISRDAYVHRLVAEAFCNHPDGNNVVNHIDNNPANNNASNLEWVKQLENVHHGMRQHRYRLNARSVIGTKDGKQLRFASAHQAANETGCDHSTIIKCCKGIKRSTHGYQWQYAEVI